MTATGDVPRNRDPVKIKTLLKRFLLTPVKTFESDDTETKVLEFSGETFNNF